MSEPKPKLDFAPQLDFNQILTNPILDIAARFWDDDRYQAFRLFYRSMRRIDDLVDDRKSMGGVIGPGEVAHLTSLIAGWQDAARRHEPIDEFHVQFYRTLDHFDLPFWPWERLCKAMIFDLSHDGFASFPEFLRYSEGAAIAPASIFVHLCGVRRSGDKFTRPVYDIRLAARHLAVFSYLVHIVRDFEKDQKAGLSYFADNLTLSHGLTRGIVKQVALTGQPTPQFRDLIATYVRIAGRYRQLARATIDRFLPFMEPRYQLSMEIIYQLYVQIFERVDPEHGLFTAEALGPSPEQIRARIELTVNSFAPTKPAQ